MTTPSHFLAIFLYIKGRNSSIYDIPQDIFVHYTFYEMLFLGTGLLKSLLKIHQNAFRSSRYITKSIVFSNFNLGNFSFSFLEGFVKLEHLEIWHCDSLHLFDLPLLPMLETLRFGSCKGLNEWTYFPNLTNGLDLLQMRESDVTDELIELILESLKTGESAQTLKYLYLGHNRLTKIPQQVKWFSALEKIALANQMPPGFCFLSGTDFTHNPDIVYLGLIASHITDIEPNFFQGHCIS